MDTMQGKTEIIPYTDNGNSLHIRQINAMLAIKDNYSGHIKDFTMYLENNSLMFGNDAIKEYITQLNKSENYSANTKRIKRQAVKARVIQLYEDVPLEEQALIDTFLKKLDKDPATKAPKINSGEVTRDMFLRPDEIKRLIETCRSRRQKLFVKFLYVTGLRVAEMAAIKLSDCKHSESMIKIRITGKGNKERFIRVDGPFFDTVRNEFQGKKYLFETSGHKAYLTPYISNQIKKIGRLINKEISAHTMRHSWAMEMIKNNPSKIDAVSKYMGHSDPSITLKMYCHNQLENSELIDLGYGLAV